MIGNKKVEHTGPLDAKILLVGEAPGEDEENQGQPFVGQAGKKLFDTLNRYGVFREDVRLANVCNYRPVGNNFHFLQNSWQLEEGKAELSEYLNSYKPNVIVPLGNHALEFLTGFKSISKYRGSIIPSIVVEDVKCIPTLHPSYVLRDASSYPIFASDIRRIINDSGFREFNYRSREYYIAPNGGRLEELTSEFENVSHLSCDIETVRNSTKILCHGFAINAEKAICLPHEPFYFPYIQRLYESNATKIFHHGLFDIPMLEYNGFFVANYTEDSFVQQHVLACELPRSLEFLTSIHTREPYYKSEGRADIPEDTKVWSEKVDKDKLYIYNCKDVCCTYEIWEALKDSMNINQQVIYNYEMQMIPIGLEIGSNGMLVDNLVKRKLELTLTQRWYKLQTFLNTIAGKAINVNSPKDIPEFLYEKLKLPKRTKTDRKTKEQKLKADEDAIVSLIGVCQDKINNSVKDTTKDLWRLKQEACKLILEIRGIRKLLSSYIHIKLHDGRAKSIYVAHAGTDTARWSCRKFIDGTGLNAQTFPRDSVDIPDHIMNASLEELDNLEKSFNIKEWISEVESLQSENENVEGD